MRTSEQIAQWKQELAAETNANLVAMWNIMQWDRRLSGEAHENEDLVKFEIEQRGGKPIPGKKLLLATAA